MSALHRHHAARLRTFTLGKSNAFTLIEMVVITAIILLMAGLILPNMVSVKQSRDLRTQAAAIQRLPVEARNEAVKVKQTVDLRIEGSNILMERTDPVTTDTTVVKTVPLGDVFSPQTAQLEASGIPPSPNSTSQGNTDVASWKWQAYADGTSDAGGLTFTVNGNTESLVIPADGESHWINGQLPQLTDQSWAAGDLEQRTTTSTSQSGTAR